MSNETKIVQISNVDLVAVLRLEDVKPIRIRLSANSGRGTRSDRKNKHAYWEFASTPLTIELMNKFNAGQLQVEPRSFSRAQRDVRGQLFAFLDEN